MRRGIGANGPRHDPSERRADQRADDARLGLLLERTYAAREARLTPTDDALAKLNAALDAIGTSPRRQTDHRRLFGACALVALLLLLLGPVARSEFALSTRNAPRSVITPITAAVGGDVISGAASSGITAPPVAVAVSETATSVAKSGQDDAGYGNMPSARTSPGVVARGGCSAGDRAVSNVGHSAPCVLTGNTLVTTTATAIAGASETPLRDLLERAGIHA